MRGSLNYWSRNPDGHSPLTVPFYDDAMLKLFGRLKEVRKTVFHLNKKALVFLFTSVHRVQDPNGLVFIDQGIGTGCCRARPESFNNLQYPAGAVERTNGSAVMFFGNCQMKYLKS